MFRLEIKTGNAAFNDGSRGATPGDELARILRAVADTLQDPAMEVALRDGGTMAGVRDVNGNTVGQWQYTAE